MSYNPKYKTTKLENIINLLKCMNNEIKCNKKHQ